MGISFGFELDWSTITTRLVTQRASVVVSSLLLIIGREKELLSRRESVNLLGTFIPNDRGGHSSGEEQRASGLNERSLESGGDMSGKKREIRGYKAASAPPAQATCDWYGKALELYGV